jgi:aerobic carbon-monoxide dehydrogenase medium subunit
MIPPAFEYCAPTSVGEAIGLLKQHGSEAKILSGGMSLIPLLKLRLAAPRFIVDINRLPGLNYIREADGFLKIGALTREADLERSELVRSKYPILADTASVIADPLVRNMATVAGNLAHGDPANDHPATMLALGAQVVATGPGGERKIPITDFFNSDGLLTEIQIPIPPAGSGGAYIKLERKVGDFATAAVAAQLTVAKGDVCERVGIGLTNAGPRPIRAKRAEDALQGKKIDGETIRQASGLASEESDPKSDLRGPSEYKRDLIRVLTARALHRALQRARGGE